MQNFKLPDDVIKAIENSCPKSTGIVPLNTVIPQEVKWLWKGHIPLGKITIIDGDPGLGKSHVTLDLAARISSRLPMPDGTQAPEGGVVLLTLEDGLADTIVPRLQAVNANISKIVALRPYADNKGKAHYPTIGDIAKIEQACNQIQARLVIVDPLMAHLDGNVNSFRDQDIRSALTPLTEMAERLDVAVIVVRHLNKSGGSQSVYRGGGSIGIIGAARCGYLVAKDPEDDNKRIFAGIKNNLAPMPPSLTFTIEGVENSSRIAWGGISSHTADALLSIPSSPEERTALDEATEFLRDTLSNGEVDSKEIQKEARQAGIAEKTLQRAKKIVGVVSKREIFGEGGKWLWCLDGQDMP